MSGFIVEKSLNGACWVLPDADLFAVEHVARRYDLPEVVARLLVQRGVSLEDIPHFLKPTLRADLPDPFTLVDMEDLAVYVAEAITEKRPMAIFGDFDVDGATSSAVLYRFLKHCGVEAPIYIPGRLTEGYGPNEAALAHLKAQGAEIVFLLDCGTTAFETIAAGRAMGLDIVVLDHHEAEMTLPDARFIVNPKRSDDASGLTMLAAVGVVFMTCVAVNAKLRDLGFYKERNLGEAPLTSFLDLVALGTVCDMVPLVGVNRLLVRQGFVRMQDSHNTGLRMLIEVSKITGEIDPYHAGFVLGPRINAGSRVDRSDLGARLLSTDDPEEAGSIAWLLEECNEKRKSIQAEMESEAIDQVEAADLADAPVLFLSARHWHSGLSGLVAGRLKEKYARPVCIATFVETADGRFEVRGSGRSVPGVHIAKAFIDARNEGLITKGGGHAMAGGFTLLPENLKSFSDFMSAHVAAQSGSNKVHVETDVDAVVTVRGANPAFVKLIREQIGPFGQEYPEPLFLFQNIRVHGADVVGKTHIRAMISDWEGGARMKAVAFRAVGTPLGEALLKGGMTSFHVLGTLKIDNWGGAEKVEMHIRDAAPASAETVQ
ncbi:MAG: single-stranded-DNA-specific exonuclease RecJ [Alphaproteobacteria bacterium]|nr:single-stranded-DNA-specific exonuclease RecJ [Alphaproteobacteria bacterium]